MDRIKMFLFNTISKMFWVFYLLVLLIVIFSSNENTLKFSGNNLLLIVIGAFSIIAFIYFFKCKKSRFP